MRKILLGIGLAGCCLFCLQETGAAQELVLSATSSISDGTEIAKEHNNDLRKGRSAQDSNKRSAEINPDLLISGDPDWVSQMRQHIKGIKKEDNPKLFELIEDINRLHSDIDKHIDQYQKETNESKRNVIKKELAVLLEKEFDLEIKRQKIEVQRLEENVLRLKKAIEMKEKYRSQIIQRNMKTATSKPAGKVQPKKTTPDRSRQDAIKPTPKETDKK